MIEKIRLLKEIIFNEDSIYQLTLEKGSIIECDEPDQGFNEDGTFTICQGMGMYHTINIEDFEVVEEN